jgi:DNA-binding MarR family transcriptional regulator
MTVAPASSAPLPPDPADAADMAARLRLAVTRLYRQLRRQVAGGLTPSQITTLATADRLGTPTLGALAAAELVQPPSMTRTVAALEASGMLERLVDPADGRVVRVRTTAEGRRTMVRIRSMRTALLAQRLRLLSDEERRRLADVVPILERLVGER